MINIREKLVELLMQVEDNMCDDCGREPVGCAVVAIADHLVANGVTIQEIREQACSSCRGAVQTDELFEVTNPHGVKVYVQFNYCPVCGRKLKGE